MSGAASGTGPVFVGGVVAETSRRVHEMLAAHPAIGTDLDFAVYAEVAELRRRMRRSIERGFIDLFCDAEALDAQLRTLVAGLVAAGEDASSGPRLCPGEPDDGARLADLVALLPAARAIHVVDDPRCAVAEALRAPGPATGLRGLRSWPRLEAALRRVRAALDAGFAAGRAAPDRVLQVSALQLAAAPEAEARRICAFLALPWEPALTAALGAVRTGDPADGLSAGARVRIARALDGHPDLAALGYEVGPGALPARVRLWGGLTCRVGRATLATRRRAREARAARGASPPKEAT